MECEAPAEPLHPARQEPRTPSLSLRHPHRVLTIDSRTRLPMRHPLRPRPAVLRPIAPRPMAWRLLTDDSDAPAGELARDKPLALLEAALLLADEPLSPRRLASLAGLPDQAAVRQLVARLRDLYDSDGSAFQ